MGFFFCRTEEGNVFLKKIIHLGFYGSSDRDGWALLNGAVNQSIQKLQVILAFQALLSLLPKYKELISRLKLLASICYGVIHLNY